MEPPISTQGSLARIGAISAPLGAAVLLATMMHPMEADPNDATLSMLASLLFVIWIIVAAIYMWRLDLNSAASAGVHDGWRRLD